MDLLKENAIKYGFTSPHCFQDLFIQHNLNNVECLKVLLAKGLGFAIILGSSLVKLPQVFKIVANGSAQGISFLGVLLELLAVTANGAYSFNHGFPFSSYGEAVFLSLQTSLIALLVLWFGGSTISSVLFTLVYGTIVFGILQPGLIPEEALWWAQAANIPMVVVGKLIQVVTNLRAGHTGQLSAVTVFLLALGSLARVFTSIQETGDQVVVATYICSSAVNVLLALQVIYYWKATQKALEKSKGGKAGGKAAQKKKRN